MSDSGNTTPQDRPAPGQAPAAPGPGGGNARGGRMVVVTQDGMGVAGAPGDQEGPPNPASQVEEPAKVMRIGSMVKQLLEEVRNAPLDEAGRSRLAQVHSRSISELEQGLSDELVQELRRITLPFGDSETPSDAELRIAHAQLVGWLEGLFHGIQAAMFAQQVATKAQLQQQMRALPGGAGGPAQGPPGAVPPGAEGDQRGGTGQYL